MVEEEEQMSCNRLVDRAACRPAGGEGTAGSAGCVANIRHIQRLEAARDMDMWNPADREWGM